MANPKKQTSRSRVAITWNGKVTQSHRLNTLVRSKGIFASGGSIGPRKPAAIKLAKIRKFGVVSFFAPRLSHEPRTSSRGPRQIYVGKSAVINVPSGTLCATISISAYRRGKRRNRNVSDAKICRKPRHNQLRRPWRTRFTTERSEHTFDYQEHPSPAKALSIALLQNKQWAQRSRSRLSR